VKRVKTKEASEEMKETKASKETGEKKAYEALEVTTQGEEKEKIHEGPGEENQVKQEKRDPP
jgi:hypothetical protein